MNKNIFILIISIFISCGDASDIISENEKTILSNRKLELEQVTNLLNEIENKLKPEITSSWEAFETIFKGKIYLANKLYKRLSNDKNRFLDCLNNCPQPLTYKIFQDSQQDHQQILNDQKLFQETKETSRKFLNRLGASIFLVRNNINDNIAPILDIQNVIPAICEIDLFSAYIDYKITKLKFYKEKLENLIKEESKN